VRAPDRIAGLVFVLAIVLSVAATSAAAGSLGFRASFAVRDRVEACPPEYPAATTVCRSFTSSAIVKGLGAATIRQHTILEPVGFRMTVSGTLSVAGLGELAFAGDNTEYPGKNKFAFSFSGGTNRLAGATGGGVVTNSLSERVVALWEATIDAPDVAFDLAAPSLQVTSTTVVRAGGRVRLRIGYAVRDTSLPVSLRAVVGRSIATAKAAPAGTISLSFPRASTSSRVTGRLTATDAVGNAVTRTFSLRV
jgi:hypothetical protein